MVNGSPKARTASARSLIIASKAGPRSVRRLHLEELKRQPERLRRTVGLLEAADHGEIGLIGKHAHARDSRYCLLEELQLSADGVGHHGAQPRDIAARTGEAGHEATGHGVTAARHDYGNRAARFLDGPG